MTHPLREEFLKEWSIPRDKMSGYIMATNVQKKIEEIADWWLSHLPHYKSGCEICGVNHRVGTGGNPLCHSKRAEEVEITDQQIIDAVKVLREDTGPSEVSEDWEKELDEIAYGPYALNFANWTIEDWKAHIRHILSLHHSKGKEEERQRIKKLADGMVRSLVESKIDNRRVFEVTGWNMALDALKAKIDKG